MLVIRMVIPWGPSFKNEPGRISCVAEPIDLDVCLSFTWTNPGIQMKTTIIQIRYMLQFLE